MADATTPDPTGFAPEPNEGAPGHAPAGGQAEPGQSPLSVGSEPDPFAERPELFVGAAFAGGFAMAKLIGRLRR